MHTLQIGIRYKKWPVYNKQYICKTLFHGEGDVQPGQDFESHAETENTGRREKMSQKRIVEEIIDENFQYSGERTQSSMLI